MARDRDAMAPSGLGRELALLIVAALIAIPGPVLRILDATDIYNYDLPHPIEAVVFGLGIFAAATLLTWASEVAETEISAGLALVLLALIAVLPEYAVDLYFAITAHSQPEHAVICVRFRAYLEITSRSSAEEAR
jgi:cation:H+ antiporter